MEIERNEDKKIISVWLTRVESRDENLQRRAGSETGKAQEQTQMYL